MSRLARDHVEQGVPSHAAQMTPERIHPNNNFTTSGQQQSMPARSSTRIEPMPLCSMHAEIPPSPANSSRKTLLCPFFREWESATRRSRFSSRTLSGAEGSTNGGRRPPPPGRRGGDPVARRPSRAGFGGCPRRRPRSRSGACIGRSSRSVHQCTQSSEPTQHSLHRTAVHVKDTHTVLERVQST